MKDIASTGQFGTGRGHKAGLLQVPLISFNSQYLLVNLA
jgi:hypothetical protein